MDFIGPFPAPLFKIVELIIVIVVLFAYFRRPMYECMLAAFLFTVAATGRYDLISSALAEPMQSPVFFAIVSFLLAAHLLARTNSVQAVVDILLPVIGRMRGGAGYVTLAASAFMASLSGTGPGNVAATGVFTIPTMIKTGFPRALAATTEMAASSLGNIIPPSGIVLLSFGVYGSVTGDELSLSRIWLIAWGVGMYFIVQRIITLALLIRRLDIKPIPPDLLPPFRTALAKNWPYLLIPIIILIPLLADIAMPALLTSRLGESGGTAFGDLALLTTPALASGYALILAKRRGHVSGIKAASNMIKSSAVTLAPVAATIFLAYAIAVLFRDLGMDDAAMEWFLSMGLDRTMAIIIIPCVMMVLGMVLPGSSQIAILGGAVISTLAALGVNPLLAAALLPAVTGAMEGMTPPLALGMYIAMGIADSSFIKTTLLAIIWVIAHLAMSILLLSGLLPLLGM